MKRRNFFETIGYLSLAPAIGSVLPGCEKKKRYNVLIIHTDEHNFRTLGCYRRLLPEKEALMWGNEVVDTPHIDSIVKRGVLLDASYVACPSCSPSRASFISGLYPTDTDVIQNGIPIRGDLETFAETLHNNGYATGYAGKWPLEGSRESIEKRHEPFCFMVSIPDPHGPDRVREPYYSMYKDVEFETPYTGNKDPVKAPAWAKPLPADHPFMINANDAAYYGMVKCIDDNVGRMLKKLDELGLTDNTIVVFTSDHGDLRGEHGRQDKGVPYEASAKVPFIMAAPGLIPSDKVVSAAFNTVDFKPTLLGLLGVTSKQASHGFDKSDIIKGVSTPNNHEKIIFSRNPGVRGNSSWLMATGSYKE